MKLAKRETQLSTKVDANALLESFLSGRKQATIDAYKKDLEIFAAFCDMPTAAKAGDLLIRLSHGEANALALRYRSHLIDLKLSSNTINRRLAALRSVCKLANRFGMIPWQLSVDSVKKERRRDVKGPGLENVKKMLAHARSQSNQYKAARDVAMITLFFTDGLRRNELLTADVSDIDLKAGTMNVLGKGKTEKVKLPIPAVTVQALTAWMQYRGNEPGAVFLNRYGNRISGRGVYHIVADIGAKVGIKVRPHGLRHTFVTEAAKDMPLHEIQTITRHAKIETLLGYLDHDEKTARNVADKVSQKLSS